MLATPDALTRDARIAGIRSEASLAAVHRRRSHLFFVMLLVLVALCVATATAPMGPSRGPVDPQTLRVGIILLSATFVIYAIEKERALRRLEAALFEDERHLEALARETDQLHRLVTAGHSLNVSLELDRVVDLGLAAAMRIFEAPGGAIFLDRGDLVVQAVQGHRPRLDLAEVHAREVADRRTPALVPAAEPDGSVGMAAPLIHEGNLVGVLVLHGDEKTNFGAGDLRTLEAFARHAAAAVANARLYRAEKTVNEQFTGLHDAEAEFRWLNAGAQ
jgi:transcriptional regulator with GAF, ATPase, and Fis domain